MKLYSIKKMVLSLVALLVILGSSSTLNATHIVGGDMTYKCLGNDEYEITLTLRRDCFNGSDEAAFDDPAIIGIYRTDGWFMKGLGDLGSGIIEIPLSFNDTLNETITSECGFVGEQVCVETTTYTKTVTLPFLEQGYTLAYQRCCRNVTLNNIIEPLETGSAYYVDISEQAMLECNSSPTFNDWAAVYICSDEDLVFDQSATDIDGDSLVYSLCMPHTALTKERPIIKAVTDLINSAPPFDEVAWSSPFSLVDLMGGTPLTIDSETGIVTAKPDAVGQYLIGVCVEEFRNGVSLGKTIRDFEYNVRICSEAPDVDFTFEDTECGGLEINFENLSVGADSYEWFFDYPNLTPTSTDVNPTHTYAESGTYEVVLIGTRDEDGCSVTTTKEVVISGEGVDASFDAAITNCNDDGTIVLHLDDTSVSTVNHDRDWTVTQGADVSTSNDDEWDVTLNNDDEVTIQLITSVGACKDTLVKTIASDELRPSVSLDYEILSCFEDSLTVKIIADFNVPSGVTLTSNTWEIFTGFGPILTLEDTMMFTMNIINIDIFDITITAEADNGCDIEYNESIDPDEVKIELEVESPHVLCLGDSTRLIANPHSNWTYTWDPTTGLNFGSTTDFSNPWAKPTETTTYNVTVTDGVCTKDTSITVMVMAGSEFEIVGETVLCDTDEVKLWAEGMSVGMMEFEWSTDPGFDPIIHTGDTLNTTLTSDSQTYYARIKDGTECTAEEKSITVTRMESAILDFTFELECGTFTVCFESTSNLADELTSWDFGDLTTTTDVATGNSVCYTYPATGDYEVTLVDLSEDCPGDTVVKTITVPELIDISVVEDMFEICEGESIVIEASSTIGDATISYCDSDGNELGTGPSIELTPGESMTITVKATDAFGCIATHDVTVVVNEFLGDLDLVVTPEPTGYAGQSYDLTVTGASEGSTFEWSTGETTETITVAPSETTTYCVTVTDINGCIEELCQTITIDIPVMCNEEDIFLPTAFSPNGDSHNDVFIVRSNVLKSIDMIVYDRWGEEVFATKTLDTGWDGTFGGKDLSPDVYAFCIRAVCINDESYIKVGNVSLLK